MKLQTFSFCAVLALTLIGCGSLNEGGLGPKAVEQLGALTGLRKAPPAAPPSVPTEALASGPGNVLLVSIVSRNAVATLTRVGRNKTVETWRTAKGVTMSFDKGVLVASRGLNQDLMGADIGSLPSAIRAGRGSGTRTHAFLDSEDQIVTLSLACEVTTVGPETIATVSGELDTIKVVESCKGPSLVFENSYWLDSMGGNIVQSRQALAPQVGFIKVNQL